MLKSFVCSGGMFDAPGALESSLAELPVSKGFSLALKGFSLTSEGAAVLCRVLEKRADSLGELELNSISFESDSVLPRVLSACFSSSRLRVLRLCSLNLSACFESLQELIESVSSLQSMDIQNCDFGAPGIRPFCRTLKSNTSLLHLGLGSVRASDARSECIGKMIRFSKGLVYLDLWSSGISAPGMRSIVEGLKLTSALECLVLKGNSSIGETGAEILADAIRLHPALAYLDLEDCGLRDRGARAIFAASAISRSLQHLNMSDNGISDDSLFHYAESIERVDFRLVSLKLNANFITSKSFVSFCQACARAKARQALCLQRLEIQGNKVSDDGMASLDFLLDSPSLAFLQLGANQISGSGILMAVPSLSINSSLKALHLNGNCIGSEGAFALCGALKGNSSLEVLGLGGSLIGDVGAVAVADLLGSRGNSIAHLNLWDNNISSIGAKALARSFEISTSISFVDLWNNRIGDDGAKAVALAVVRNPMIIDLSMNYPSEKFSQGVSQVLSRNREIQRRLKKVCFLIAAKRLCFGWSMFDKHIVRAIWEFSDIK